MRGTVHALTLLERICAALPPGYPVLVAGGIAERDDVRAALEAGAAAAVAGTRFLLSAESCAHPGYKRRLLGAETTLLTDLFGAGWPAPHRVVPNAATERWLGPVDAPPSRRRSSFGRNRSPKDERRRLRDALRRAPAANRVLNHLMAPGSRYLPSSLQGRLIVAQRPGSRVLTPAGATDDGPGSLVEAGPLYAGETVARIGELRQAADLVRELAG